MSAFRLTPSLLLALGGVNGVTKPAWQMLGKCSVPPDPAEHTLSQVDHSEATQAHDTAQRRITSHVAGGEKAAPRQRGHNIDLIIYDELMPHESS